LAPSELTAIASPVLAIPHCCDWPVNIGPRFAGFPAAAKPSAAAETVS
jgi:hypothetical protein